MRKHSRLWIVAILLACLTAFGTHHLLASRAGDTAAAAPEALVAVGAQEDCAGQVASLEGESSSMAGTAPGDTLAAGGGKGCGDCPRTIGLKCRRVSCSPCCYECPDSQFPYCTE